MARSNVVEIILKGTDKASKTFDKVEKSAGNFESKLASVATGAAVVTGAVVAFGFAAKKAFDLGKEGAQLLLVEQRFNRLAVSIGTTGDALMDDLGPAMGGMTSKSEKMQLAMELMSLGLVKSHDEAIRLAGVAGQLNMNMNQLVLTLTNQTTMRFDALGIAVDGFNEKVKELESSGMSATAAFQEAFLRQAEGAIEKVGSTTDTTAEAFAEFEANIKDVKDEGKKLIAQFLGPVLKDLNNTIDAQRIWNEARKEGIITTEEAVELQAQVRDGLITEAEMIATASRRLEYFTELQGYAAAEGKNWDAQNHDLAYSLYRLNNLLSENIPLSNSYAHRAREAAKANAEAAKANAKNNKELDKAADLLKDVDTALRSTIDTYKEQIKWVAAGGQQLVDEAEEIRKRFDAGLIDETAALWALDQIQLGTVDIGLELGQLTTDEAVEQLVAMGYPVDDAKVKVAEFQESLFKLVAQDYLINVNVQWNDTGVEPPSGGGDDGGGDDGGGSIPIPDEAPREEYQRGTGGWRRVPSGNNNDSFNIGLSSGEAFNVMKPGQKPSGGGHTFNFNVANDMDVYEVAQQVIEILQ